ncbi:MAG: KamA family radical SAM protein [Verrucomicrobia bacterium]|nr:KamA family radical SAM protein [Verrucomicrobiota bacterium]
MSATFRRQYFPAATARDWANWQWQLLHAFRTREQLAGVLKLTTDEEAAFTRSDRPFPVSITPHYLSRMRLDDPQDPLRLTMVPRVQEHQVGPGELWDPLGEEPHSPVPRIVHTYPDKVLFLATDFCATYCRYCTRARVVGSGKLTAPNSIWEEALCYIAQHAEIRDVLVTGGDPLTLADARLDWLLARLRAIPHVQILRIGTKLPAVLPQRITPSLVHMLRRHAPLWLSIHFTHPNELSPEVARGCIRLADAGIPMVSQTVLLKGVNDSTAVLKDLFEKLLTLRVTPYYLHQCDPIVGSSHFRTPVATGQQIIRDLHGRTTGFAIPSLMIDAPGGGGKVPVGPNYIAGRDGADLLLKNYADKTYRYHDPV